MKFLLSRRLNVNSSVSVKFSNTAITRHSTFLLFENQTTGKKGSVQVPSCGWGHSDDDTHIHKGKLGNLSLKHKTILAITS